MCKKLSKNNIDNFGLKKEDKDFIGYGSKKG